MSLKLINKLEKSQTIDQFFVHRFAIERDGIYLIEITASAKSHQQNHSRNKFQDDGLTAQIDNHVFDQKPAIWNGNDLKNLQKTVVLIVYLEKSDNHNISLIPRFTPYLKQINIYQTTNQKVIYQPTINNPAEDGDRRPWYSFIFQGQIMQGFAIFAKCKDSNQHATHSNDDDDLQLKIDNKIINNNDKNVSSKHKYWYWCGKLLKGNIKPYSIEKCFKSGYHTLELHADRIPEIDRVYLNIVIPETPQPIPRIKEYKSLDNENYNQYDEEIFYAVDYWNKEYSQQKFPPPEPLDPNLIKTMVYIESRIGYGVGSNQAYPDIMQVADTRNPAIHTLNNDGWINPKTGKIARESEFENFQEYKTIDYDGKANGSTPAQSINWGVRWLYHKAQKFYGTGSEGELSLPYIREWESWKQAVTDYNDSDRKIKYQQEVWQLYEKGTDPDGKQIW